MNQVKLQSSDILNYILAGKAVFTLQNTRTGNRFTYKVKASDDRQTFFVKVLCGADNTSAYNYCGFIRDNKFIHGGMKAKIGREARSVLAINWFMSNLGNLGPVEVYSSGHCARCGRLLTVPSSVSVMFGPECLKKIAA